MATLDPGQVKALSIAVQASIIAGWQNMNSGWGDQFGFFTPVTVDNESFTYVWIQDFAQIQTKSTFYDTLTRRALLSQKITATMKHYGDAVAVPTLEANLTKTVNFIDKAQDVGRILRNHPTELARAFIAGGTSNELLYDAQYLYDDAHPRGGTTFDNLLAGDISATTLTAARVAMMRFPSDTGEAMGLIPNVLLCTVDSEYTARQLINSTTIPGSTVGELNPLQGIVANIVAEAKSISTGDADFDDWYIFATQYSVKPFFLFNLMGYETPQITDNTYILNSSDSNKILTIQAEISHTVYPTYPFLTVKMVGA